MKSDLKLKFLHSLNQLTNNERAGMFNLLVVASITIALVGIVPVLALPSYVSQGTREVMLARQREARQNINTMNKVQQAYFTEHNTFLTNVTDFEKYSGAGIKMVTPNYAYTVVGIPGGKAVANLAKPAAPNSQLRSYVGGVAVVKNSGGDLTSSTVLCESSKAAISPTPAAIAITPTSIKCVPPFIDAK